MLIKQQFGTWEGIWADGYLPTTADYLAKFPDLVSLWKRELEEGRDIRAGDPTRDELFGWELSYSWVDLRDPTDPKTKKPVEAFYLNLSRYNSKTPAAIKREIQEDSKREDYRAVILAKNYELVGSEDRLLRWLVSKSFGIKEEDRYVDMITFEQEASRILERVLDPYVIPCGVAERFLASKGFKPAYEDEGLWIPT